MTNVIHYRCSICDLNWPHLSQYSRCPQCETSCTVRRFIADVKVMTAEEAETLVRHVRFEKAYMNESSEQREARWLAYERELEQRQRKQQETFDDVIGGAGFSVSERATIEELEARLPSAHHLPHDFD